MSSHSPAASQARAGVIVRVASAGSTMPPSLVRPTPRRATGDQIRREAVGSDRQFGGGPGSAGGLGSALAGADDAAEDAAAGVGVVVAGVGRGGGSQGPGGGG